MTEPIRKLGRYELLRQLATGGMGEIYLARTRGAGGFEKHLIIKTILPHLAEQEEFVTKFLDEGRIVVQLTHGNIVPVFDMGEEDGEYYIAMEYVPGLDLRAIIKRLSVRDEELPVAAALYITCEICKGLGYAHRKTDADGNHLGIVHRDVSPSNVLVSREGEVKIIDFGIARAASRVAETATGQIQGKCCYMSPEQARGETLDARSDIFSTGVLLYEMLTLERPFEGDSDLETLELVRNCEADPPGVLRPEIPEAVDEIVGRAMEPDPDDRYESIDEMFVDLQQEMYGLGETVTSQRLVDELADVFEDDEADDAEEDQRRPPADLDEALELELARLEDGDDAPASDSHSPLELASTKAAGGGTRTLTPSSDPGPEEATGPGSPPEAGPEPGTEPEVDEPASSPETDTDDRPPADETGAETESGRSEAPPTAETPGTGLGRRHLVGIALAAVVVAAGVATVSGLRPPPFDDATLEVDSEPAGAEVHVDGEFTEKTTPATLELEPGDYDVELRLEDHHPYSVDVQLDPGEEYSLDERDLTLSPRQQPERKFTVSTEPEDATILGDGEQLGTAPVEVTIAEDEVVNLSARASGCSPVYYTLSHGHSRREIHLELNCEDREADEREERVLHAERQTYEASDAPPSADRSRSVRIETEPAGAEVVVDDEPLGEAPLETELPRGEETTIEARHPGYEPFRTTRRIEERTVEIQLEERPQGCLDFRALYPANNKIAVDGEWLEGRHMALEDHALAAGDHTVTVHHPESGKRESFEVEVEPGDDCTVLTVWERE